MFANFICKNPLLASILGFLTLGVFWFYGLASPWLAFVNSDSAVPFQMATQDWLPQDLFYWQTSRMGMLYEVIWKAVLSLFGIRQAIVGNELHTQLFYLAHNLLVFVGFAFWIQLFKTRSAKFLFLLLFLPITHSMAEYLLSPGQPYGIVFFLNGLFLWNLLKTPESRRKQLTLGLLLGILFIQHELAALIAVGLYAAQYGQGLAPIRQTRFLPLWAVFLPIVAIAFYFKAQSRQWDPGAHYRMVDVASFLNAIWFTIQDGSWWINIRRGTGHVITVAMIVYLVEMFQRRREKPFYRDVVQSAFVAVIVAYLMIHLTRWFVLNGKSPRYFTNLIPLLIWIFLDRWESLPRYNFKKFAYLVACVVPVLTVQAPSMWLNPIVRAQLLEISERMTSDPATDSVLACNDDIANAGVSAEQRDSWLFKASPSWTKEYCKILAMKRAQALARSVESVGCASYADEYWNSHLLAVVSNGRILTSAVTHIRNPVLLARVVSARPFCIMPRPEVPFQNYLSQLDCKKTPLGFLICE